MRPSSSFSSSPPRSGSIVRRVLGFALAPNMIFLVLACWVWAILSDAERTLSAEIARQVDQALLAKDMRQNVIQVQQFLSDVSATRGQDGLDDGFEHAAGQREVFLASLQRFQAANADAQAAQELEALRTSFDAYYRAGVTMAQAYVAGGPRQGNPMMDGFDADAGALQEQMDRFVNRNVEASSRAVDAMVEELSAVRLALLGASLLTGLALALTGLWLGRSIARPLQAAVSAVEQVADGRLHRPVTATTRDEIGVLMAAIDRMRVRLAGTVGAIRGSADAIQRSSEELASGSRDLSGRTESSAASLQQTSAGMQVLTERLQASTVEAREAGSLASSAADVARRGGALVDDVVQTMTEIEASSKRIEQIVGVIDGLAFQTNLLALNAAVEAARAGPQGRGFGVVANEVRTLAQRSASASHEIRGLIGGSAHHVQAGMQRVSEAGSTMQAIVGSAQRVQVVVQRIAQTAELEAGKTREVQVSLGRIDEATQQNSALVEQSSASAEQLREHAHRLNAAVAVFQLP